LKLTSNNTEWLSQRIENEFKLFAEEWFADYTLGMEHYGKTLKKKVDIDDVTSLYFNKLKNITGVQEVISFEVDYVGQTRKLTIDFVVMSDEGNIVENSFVF
jgi:hypothetical protein